MNNHTDWLALARLTNVQTGTRKQAKMSRAANLIFGRVFVCIVLFVATFAAGQDDSSSRHLVAGYISSRQYSEALAQVKELLQVHSGDASLWTLQGLALDGLGRTAESLASFDHALLIDSAYLPALEGASQTAYLHRDPKAMDYVLRLLAADHRNKVAHAMAGVLYYDRHDCPQSIAHFKETTDAVYRSSNALSEFTDCLLKEGAVTEATEALSRGLDQNAASTQIRYNLAVAELAGHNPTKAIEVLSSIPRPNDSDFLNLLAEAYVEAERPDDAFRTLQDAITLKPDEERNYLDLAILCLEHNKEDLAVSVSSKGISKLAAAASLYLIRGVAYAQLAQYTNAESDFQAAAKIEPDQPHGTIAMSLLFSDRNQIDKEKDVLLHQIKVTPNDAVTNYLLADLLIRQGAEPGQPAFYQAKTYLTSSLKSKPDSAEAQTLMSKVLEEQGDLEGALAYSEAALKVDPTYRTALYRSFIILQKQHRKQDASDALSRLKAALEHDLKKGGAGGQMKIDPTRIQE
jgi:tetratricopeptide (TPR) repeat protein